MNQPEKKRMGKCPSCGENIDLGDRLWVGQLFTCSSCEDELEIIQLNPIVLDWSYNPGDDYYNYDEKLEFGGRIRG
jgi:lysine biosynthesis protein LysW